MEKAISSDLIRGHIDTIILHSLLDGDKYAQQISDSVDKKSENQYSLNQATLYSSLKRLENLKYVIAYWNDADGGRRRYFKLTELGKDVVDQNLANWSYSRAIIDKLMDFTPTPIYQTKIVEKIVTIPQPVVVSNINTVEKPETKTENSHVKEQTNVEPTTINSNKTAESSVESEQEVNFRNILNGLIKTQVVSEKAQQEEIKPINAVKELKKEPIQTASDDKLKFNETLNKSDYKLKSNNPSARIDYGEMAIQAEKDGYKLLFSSKEPKKIVGNVYVNKLNLFSSLSMFLIVMIELLFVLNRFNSVFKPEFWMVALFITIMLIYPIVTVVRYIKNPSLTTNELRKDTILTALIVVFNLLLITFAVDLLVGVEFSNKLSLLLAFIIPCMIYLDIFIYFVIRYSLSKMKDFSIIK